MSNNSTSKEIGPLFIKLSERSITKAEKIKLNTLLRNCKEITQDEYLTIRPMIIKIASVEERTEPTNMMSNENKAKHQQKLNADEITYLVTIIKKLTSRRTDKFFINKEKFSGIFPNGESFQDFITNRTYVQAPHRQIGKGGFGSVFLLQFPEQQFVLKEMILPNEHYLMLAQNEIQALQHVIGKWYAVQLYASAILFNRNSMLKNKLGIAYILYPYIPGRTLAEYQKESHTEEEERHVYLSITKAVKHLHKTGILHSDIKPENIWVPNDPTKPPFLLDFGLVQSLQHPIARNAGTSFFWSAPRYKKLHSTGKSEQPMTKGINWVATTRTLTGNRINNVPNISPNQEPHIRNLLRRLYHSKNEGSIRRKNITSILKRHQPHENNNSSNSNNNANRNRTRRKTSHIKNNNPKNSIVKGTTFKSLHNSGL